MCFHETLLPLRSFQRMLKTHRKVPLPMAGGWNSTSSNPNHSGILCRLCDCKVPITGGWLPPTVVLALGIQVNCKLGSATNLQPQCSNPEELWAFAGLLKGIKCHLLSFIVIQNLSRIQSGTNTGPSPREFRLVIN